MEAVDLELSAGGIIWRQPREGEVEVLVIEDRYGNWGFPKGHIEPGETSREAALRECEEEISLRRLHVVESLGTIDWYFRSDEGTVHKFCDYFLLRADADDVATPKRSEGVRAVRWLGPDEVVSQVTYDNARQVLGHALESLGSRTPPPDPGGGSAGRSAPMSEGDAPPRDARRGSRRILLTGGTGFVGGHIAKELVARGHRIRAVVRDPNRADELSGLGAELVKGDVLRRETLTGAADGCDAVIHLVAIIREQPPGRTFEAVNVQGTAHVVEEARRAGVARFVQMSALGARPEGTEYHRSKFEGEEIVRRSELRFVILRPSIIVGEGSAFIAIVRRLMRFLPIIPIIGDGQYRLQPIDVKDVARAAVQSVERDDLRDSTLELGGPHKLTYNRILEIAAEVFGYRRGKVHVPVALVSPLARLGSRLPIPVPITPDELTMLLEENVVQSDGNPLRDLFGIDPTPFRAVLQRLRGGEG